MNTLLLVTCFFALLGAGLSAETSNRDKRQLSIPEGLMMIPRSGMHALNEYMPDDLLSADASRVIITPNSVPSVVTAASTEGNVATIPIEARHGHHGHGRPFGYGYGRPGGYPFGYSRPGGYGRPPGFGYGPYGRPAGFGSPWGYGRF